MFRRHRTGRAAMAGRAIDRALVRLSEEILLRLELLVDLAVHDGHLARGALGPQNAYVTSCPTGGVRPSYATGEVTCPFVSSATQDRRGATAAVHPDSYPDSGGFIRLITLPPEDVWAGAFANVFVSCSCTRYGCCHPSKRSSPPGSNCRRGRRTSDNSGRYRRRRTARHCTRLRARIHLLS